MARSYIAKAPSNIAFAKYWGKSEESTQWPANDSLSMTLSACHTHTEVRVLSHKGSNHHVEMGGVSVSREDKRAGKVFRHLDLLQDRFGLEEALSIRTHNTFPTGCGIASSASGLAALTIGALAAWTGAQSFAELDRAGFSRMHLAHLARLGSGSACRSLWGGYVLWQRGICPEEQKAIPLEDASHWNLRDVVLVVDGQAKAVSSTEGHRQAYTSPLFEIRQSSLLERVPKIREAIVERDFKALGPLLEEEALEMHAVMLSQTPSLNYLQPDTRKFIAWLRELRVREGIPVYFTLDAGPNPHLICEEDTLEELLSHLKLAYPQLQKIVDGVGQGPTLEVIG